MEYSELIKAIEAQDQPKVETYSESLRKVLFHFLIVRLGASKEDAEDSAQNAMLSIISRIKDDLIQHPDALLSYAFTTARNDYLKRQDKMTEVLDENIDQTMGSKGDQLSSLIDHEKKKLLEECVGELNSDHRSYMQFWFTNPGMDADEVANHFQISVNNAWTKKHRIIKLLKDCFKTKENL